MEEEELNLPLLQRRQSANTWSSQGNKGNVKSVGEMQQEEKQTVEQVDVCRAPCWGPEVCPGYFVLRSFSLV